MVQNSHTSNVVLPSSRSGPTWLPRSRHAARRALAGYLFLLPAFALFAYFFLYPTFYLLYLSFTDWNLLQSSSNLVGLSNYQDVLTNAEFGQSLLNTAYFVLNVPIGMALALLIAVGLSRIVRGRNLLRALYFLPAITPAVPVAMIFLWLYNPDIGLFNYLLRMVGIAGPRWLGSHTWAMPAMILMGVWGSLGYKMIIYLAGLSSIPVELYEAATVDGATGWHRFRYITWPLLMPVNLFILVTSTISSFQVFSSIYVMTQGGPLGATTTVAYLIYQNAFEFFQMGIAAAMAVVLLVMLVLMALLQLGIGSRRVTYLG